MASVHNDVQDYYGKTLSSSSDLKTTACCTRSNKSYSKRISNALSAVHKEVLRKYYGCGLVFPEAVEGCNILDLGCGSGRDCYILSQLVGTDGHITGVDMTKEQVEVARTYIDYHMTLFGYSKPNITFIEGYIENLEGCGISNGAVDIIISNCVFNLCPNKHDVLKGAQSALKEGGELYFSDIYTNQPLSQEAKSDKVLHGECIAGALEWKELMEIAVSAGFAPPVLVDVSPVSVNNPELKELLGGNKFCSATYRLFKLSNSSSVATGSSVEVKYNGTIEDFPEKFQLSYDIILTTSSSVVLPASVAQLLSETRLGSHFTFTQTDSVSSFPELDKYVHVDPFEVIGRISSQTETSFKKCC